MLADIARHMADDEFCYELRLASTQESLIRTFESFDQRNSLPTGKAETAQQLPYSGRLGGGLMSDLRRRAQTLRE